MAQFIASRLLRLVLSLLGISTVMFFLLRLSGDPALMLLPSDATMEDVHRMRAQLGLDAPIPVQYFQFLGGIVRLDFQQSIQYRQPALLLVLDKLPATFHLAFAAVGFSIALGLPAGIVAAVYRGAGLDRLLLLMTSIGQALPTFWLGVMLILVFAVNLRVFPAMGNETASSIVLPTFALGCVLASRISRLVRSSVLEVLGREFIMVARSKGLSFITVLLRHAVRNALIPVVTVIAIDLGHLIGGAVITETIFAWPGVGRLLVTAVFTRDYPVVQADVFVVAVIVVLLNLGVDALYNVLDPRIRISRGGSSHA